MKIMVIGGGGREHAIIKKLKENKNIDKIYAIPGNGGIAADAECVDIGACELEKIVAFAKENSIDFAVVAPDDPLVLGLVDCLEDAGAESEIIVINNLSADAITHSVNEFAKQLKQSQIVFIPGGFSGGDEPEGSAKFITAFFRNPEIKEGIADLLEHRDGLMCGICNGFQALIKLGLVPYGRITDTDETCPTLTFNTIARHQSKIVRTRIASNKSPWLSLMNVGDIVSVPISHGEGRFLASDALVKALTENGQIATQYVDLDGCATNDIRYNPNDSANAIEGITSPDGRVFGKMGHSERVGSGLYKNVPGNYDIRMFESAVKYFK